MDAPFTLAFDTFWLWLASHPNCILRGGTLDSTLYDDDDLHWYFAQEGDGVLVVQLIRGKRLLGELFLEPEKVDYVQALPVQNEGEYMFELVSEKESGTLYFFVLSHGYEEDQGVAKGRVH